MSSTNSATSTLAGVPEPSELKTEKALSANDAEQGIAQPTYKGMGTEASPYIVTWAENDSENPMTWSGVKKWLVPLNRLFVPIAAL
ncbi:hypothetical protein JCM5353_005559 [Sporobolomyces roseus]